MEASNPATIHHLQHVQRPVHLVKSKGGQVNWTNHWGSNLSHREFQVTGGNWIVPTKI